MQCLSGLGSASTPTPHPPPAATASSVSGRAVFKGSAFTGKADYYEALFFLQDVLYRAQAAGAPLSSSALTALPWYAQEAMAERMGFSLTKLQYRKLRNALNALAPYVHLAPVRLFLNAFCQISIDGLLEGPTGTATGPARSVLRGGGATTPLSPSHGQPDLGHIDELGRAVSVGRRKSAAAKVYLVPGSGECYVNGRPAIQYFQRPHEMFRLADPLEAAHAFDRFNVWCLVRGGGWAGQAGAIVQALAKAMSLMDSKLAGSLRPFLYRDRRVVERKKSGQPKARKKFTWVKR